MSAEGARAGWSIETKERLLAIGSPVALLVIWQLMSWLEMLDARFIPSPITIFEGGVVLIRSGELWTHLSVSLLRLAAGFVLGTIPGIAIGLLMGLSRYVRAALDPIVAATYPVPKIAILPLIMLYFGIGEASKIVMIAIAVVYLVLINTMVGVMTIDAIYFDVAKNYNAPWRKLFTRVIIPGALPLIFAGLRLSLGVSLIVIVSAEFVAAKAGIGYLIWSSWETLVIENMFVGIIVITVLGVLTTFLLKELERVLIPWRRERA
jgi:ABC-type nitrate/sulfonate/bicarbonate transport system permease component